MTNRKILDIAMAQSAIDLNCRKEDFLKSEPVIALSAVSASARRYLKLPFDCNLVTYGSNIVASVLPQYRSFVEEYLKRTDRIHCFETPNLYELNRAFAPYRLAVCFMAEYFLPDLNHLKRQELPGGYELRLVQRRFCQKCHKERLSPRLDGDDREGSGIYRADDRQRFHRKLHTRHNTARKSRFHPVNTVRYRFFTAGYAPQTCR